MAWDGTSDALTGDTVSPTLPVASINLKHGGVTYENPDMVLALNIDEPPGDEGVVLESMTATFYDTDGSILFDASTDGPYALAPQTDSALAGWLFVLDVNETEANTFLSNDLYRLGLEATFTGSAGGPEHITVGALSEVEVIPLPGAAGLAMLGMGMLIGYHRLRSGPKDCFVGIE